MKKSIALVAVVGLVAVPAVGLAGGNIDAGYPIAQLRPLKIATPTATLSTGGSVVKLTVTITPTGTQGFPASIQVDAGLGAMGCREATITTKKGGPFTTTISFTLSEPFQGPGKVTTQVFAASTSFRAQLKNFTVTAK